MTRDITAERALAQHRLAEAEVAMKRAAGVDDAGEFAAAKAEKQAALDQLERLEWAEKAQEEEAERAVLEKKMADLRRRQEESEAAHGKAQALAGEAAAAVDRLVTIVKQLQEQKAIIEVGVNYEAYGVKDGLIQRSTISPTLNLGHVDIAVKALRAGRELARLSSINLSVAEQRASQGSL